MTAPTIKNAISNPSWWRWIRPRSNRPWDRSVICSPAMAPWMWPRRVAVSCRAMRSTTPWSGGNARRVALPCAPLIEGRHATRVASPQAPWRNTTWIALPWTSPRPGWDTPRIAPPWRPPYPRWNAPGDRAIAASPVVIVIRWIVPGLIAHANWWPTTIRRARSWVGPSLAMAGRIWSTEAIVRRGWYPPITRVRSASVLLGWESRRTAPRIGGVTSRSTSRYNREAKDIIKWLWYNRPRQARWTLSN